jgi:hypothetical protein
MTIVVPSSIRVLMPNGRVTEMKLETYLAGAVVTEMGANAPLEALKAQAVASRTYAAAAHRHSDVGADVCTTAHCQEWKRVDPIVAPEVFRAVSETWGTVAAFDGKLIDAFFFEHCDGHTRSAADAHISPVPYLQSVLCDCGFVAMKGHGVGLCQRGAIVMARRGVSFEEILQYYYRNVVVVHSGRERTDERPVAVTPTVRPTKRPEPTPAHPKRPKAPPPPPAHRIKTTHKPIPARRLLAKTDKPKEEPTPVKRKEPLASPPSLQTRKSEPEKKPVQIPASFTPPPVPPQQTAVERAAPTEALEQPTEPEQTAFVPPPAADMPLVMPSSEARPSLPLEPVEEEPLAEESALAEPLPTVAAAPTEPSESVSAATVEPAVPISVESTAPFAFSSTEPAESTPTSETPPAAEAIAALPAEPVESRLLSEGMAEVETIVEVPAETIEVPAYVEHLNNPALLAEVPPEAPAAAEPLLELMQDESTPVEPQPEPCEPDSLPELALPTLREITRKPVRVHIDHLPGERIIAGCLSIPGIMITVLDQRGNETLVMSGSAPHYGEGGFETVVEDDGCYVVWIDGEAIKLEVQADTAFIHII